MTWRLVVTPKVEETLRVLPPQTKRYIRASFEEICKNPWIGKPLRDELTGFRSFRVKQFRIVYEIKRQIVTVVVIGVGPRRMIYEELTAGIHPKSD